MGTQVHRYYDTVAAYLGSSEGNGKTVYMTPQQAKEFGEALIKTANDTDKVEFTESTISTFWGRSIDG